MRILVVEDERSLARAIVKILEKGYYSADSVGNGADALEYLDCGNYDAVIIGHSQFERIPISDERQEAMLRKQIDDLEMAIQSARYEQDGGRYTVKQIEKTRKTLQTRLEKLNQKEKKDQVVTFEELGVDHLYVDEAHSYKNAFLYTKMRNVAGIAQNEAQKSADMFNKCQYLDEITGGKGITFATGTPILSLIHI